MGWWCGQVTGIGSETLKLFSSPGLWLATGLLLVMVVGSWLLLRFTRLGRAHLLTKCAVLSLLAHLLFGIYAWRTFFAQPSFTGPARGTMMVRLIEPSDQPAAPQQTPAELPVWEQFAETREMPQVEPLARPLVEPELDVERVFEPTESLALEEPEPELPDQRPLEPLPEVRRTELSVPELLPLVEEKSEGFVEAAEVVPPQENRSEPELEAIQREAVADAAPAPERVAAGEEPKTELAEPPPQLVAEPELDSLPEDSVAEEAGVRADPASRAMPAMAAAPPASAEPAPLLQLPPPPAAEALEPRQEPVPVRPAGTASNARAVPAEYAERTAERRAAAVAARGGSEQTEQAVESALAWLASQQRPDGRWDPRLTGGGLERMELGQERRGAGMRADNGITGLALLAFLGAGHTPQQGKYRENVARGVEYLIQTQAADGFLGGPARNFERTYCHGMAALALGEALAMTADPSLRGPVQRAVSYTTNSQSRQDGGWRYQPGEAGDMSQFGWQVLALRSAELGGVPTPAVTREGMQRFLNAATRGPYGGLGCYRPGEGHSPTMTAEALLCRQLLEPRVDPRTVDEAADYLLRTLPTPNAVNEYYWYYGTLALYHSGGRAWEIWNERMTETLLRRQLQAGADAGAWPAEGMWAGYGGKVFSTALSTLCLEVYYRYLPLYEQR